MGEALDRLLGAGVVTVGPDGFLALDERALGAQRHRAGERCWCPTCVAGREKGRRAALAAYLTILQAEDPVDAEEVARVRRELPKRAPAPHAAQPWQPRPGRRSPLFARKRRYYGVPFEA